ncbi:MAG: DUF4347 domain-containing protein [Cyanobacteria bacterium P01_E01_bin.6]
MIDFSLDNFNNPDFDTTLVPSSDPQALVQGLGVTGKHLVFVDESVSRLDEVIQSIQDATVVILASNDNGVVQVTETLQSYQSLDSVHFIGHGQSGTIQLGNTLLNTTTLAEHASIIDTWSNALSEDADLLFYGCNVASGSVGIDLINQLHDITGADIAASDNITGAIASGGDWIFEVTVGEIATEVALSNDFMATYDATLASQSVLFVAGDIALSESDLALQARLEGLGYTVTVQDDGLTNSSDADGHNLIFISESVSSSRVNTKFTNTPVPVVVTEGFLFDDLALTGDVRNVDYGIRKTQTTIEIVDADNPLSAGLTGNIAAFTEPSKVNWGQPSTDAQTASILVNDGDRATIFGYEQASTLANGINAPSRRVGFFLGSNAQQLTDEGWQLFDASISWATDETPPPTDTEAPTATLAASDITSNGETTYEFTVTYEDATAVSVSSLGSTDVRVVGPNGFNQLASFVDASPNTDGSPITVTYQISAPGAEWDANDNGTFNISLETSEVEDSLGNTNDAIVLGQFDINISSAPGILQLGATEISVNEGAGFVTLEFLRTNGSAGTATLDYATIELTATPDVDYPNTIETITFAPGETRKTVDIPIVDDSDLETDETFGIGLTGGSGAILGAPRTAVITIVDDDNPPASSANILFVAGSATLNASDQIIQQQFEQLGHNVIVQDDDVSNLDDTIGNDLVFISESVKSSRVRNKFAPATIPVISAEAFIFDDMGLTGGSRNNDYGTLDSKTSLTINQSTNPSLTAGLSGEVAVYDVASEIAWGNPNANAFKVANLPDNSSQAGIFAYDEGAALVNGDIAAARRLGFFIGSDAQNVSVDGWKLFESTVNWALGTPDDISPGIAFTSSEITTNEGDGTVDITVRRFGDSTGEVQVDYATTDGSAQAGTDYTETSGTLILGDGIETSTISIPILENTLLENSEELTLQLSNPIGIALGDVDTVTLTILDNDVANGDFVKETILSGLNLPTAFDWTPSGDTLFIAEKSGLVKVAQNDNVLTTPFIDLQERVNTANDRGLSGIAVHPDFANNPYVYLAYTFDPPEVQGRGGLSGPDGAGNRPAQVIRVTADPSTNFTTALPNSDVVILGKNSTWANTTEGNSTSNLDLPPSGITEDGENIPDYITTDSTSHSVGSLQFGIDGSLFVSTGDGASFNFADPRAIRVQDIDNLSGKILRIDPMTGEGLSDNPFFDDDVNSNRSKVYSYGFRNPFRFTIHPETNEPFVGDVGWTQWEEINTGRGTNHGWPYFEGGNGINLQTNEYDQLPEAQAFYSSGEDVEAPIFALDHFGSDRMRAIIMGDFYDGGSFPAIYDEALFFNGFRDGDIYYMSFESNGDVQSVELFEPETPGIVQISTGPDSYLYFLDLFNGSVGRWRFQNT